MAAYLDNAILSRRSWSGSSSLDAAVVLLGRVVQLGQAHRTLLLSILFGPAAARCEGAWRTGTWSFVSGLPRPCMCVECCDEEVRDFE